MRAKCKHINLIARDWQKLAAFYEQVFGCARIPPERHLSGEWLEKGRISYESGDYEGAVRAYSAAIDLDARGAVHFNRGIAYFKMRHNARGLQDLKAAAGLGHGQSQKILRSKGVSW